MVSIIIVNHNTKQQLEKCLESVRRYEPDTEKEVIIVDNGSSDSSQKMLETSYPEISLIRNPTNIGPSKARNQAIKQSKGQYILLLDSDTYLVEPIIDKLKAFLKTNESVAVAGPRILNPDKTFQRSCFSYPTLLKSFADISLLYLLIEFFENKISKKFIFFMAALFRQLLKTNMFTFQNFVKPTDCDLISGCCFMLKRNALEKVGLFDEKFFIYFEEADVCLRLKKLGYKITYLPSTTAAHSLHANLCLDLPFITLQRFNSLFYFYKKHYKNSTIIIFRLLCIPALLWSIIIYPAIKSIGFRCKFRDFLQSRLAITNSIF